MTKLIYQFADIISRPISFSIICFCTLLSSAYGILTAKEIDVLLLINLAKSDLAIIIAAAIMVSSLRDGLAIQLKLDELIKSSEANNKAIGIENENADRIEAEKRKIENEHERI